MSLNQIAWLAYCDVNLETLTKLLEQLKIPKSELSTPFDELMLSHIAKYICYVAKSTLMQFTAICNTLAYNRAQVGTKLPTAIRDSITAITITAFLQAGADRTTSEITLYRRQMAQYMDTYGWVKFRRSVPVIKDSFQNGDKEWIEKKLGLLEEASSALTKGIDFDSQRAIIYYHLARVYVAFIEFKWASQTDKEGFDVYVDSYLYNAFREWRNAKKHDRFDRLHTRLIWLYDRINLYKENWEKHKAQGIGQFADAKNTSKSAN